MIFNSVTYILFLTLIVALYWCLRRRMRLWLLFGASITFYGFWRFDFVPVMVFSAVVDFFVSLQMARTQDERKRGWLLGLSLLINLGLLFYFKYLIFATESAFEVARWMGFDVANPALSIVLPLGISFYTFQTISYSIDVYRRQIEPIRDFVLYGCYVTFFPQLVAGPILRASEVCDQLNTRPKFSLDFVSDGVSRILCGLFLKVCLADNVASFVNDGFEADPSSLTAIDVWTLAFLFGFQIYFDFSAYSHIAIGSAKLMGISFPENFCFPYVASSPKDFWGRWHISLSSWIRDYLYLPLCGVKFGKGSTGGLKDAIDRPDNRRRNTALIATWAIMGFWHGAGMCFLFWGLFHATMILIYRISGPLRKTLPKTLRVIGGPLITVPSMMAGWIFFRAASVAQALTMYSHMLNPAKYNGLGLRENFYLVAALLTVAVPLAYIVWKNLESVFDSRPWLALPARSLVYAVMFAFVLVFLRPIEQFIYFQF